MRRAALLLALAAALLAPAPAPAPASQAITPRAELVDIEDEVMCVTCRIPLNVAEGAQPDSQRALIRDLIAEGRTKEQIKDALVAEYGEGVLSLPDREGFGLTAYGVPLALLALLVASLALLLPRWRARGREQARAAAGSADDPEATLSDSDARRLDDDLRRYER
jgi:cytochrome c-type biogenesis protein CcmH/NrfF